MLRKQVSHYAATAVILGMTLASANAIAKVSAEQATELGKSLTPVGAVAAGNKEGTIPKWTGASNFDDYIKNLKPQDLEDMREQFNAARAAHPDDFNALLKYMDNFKLADYDSINNQVTKIINELPPAQKQLAQQYREQMGSAEKPFLIIDPSNMAQYAEHMTAGQQALMKKYPDYRMIVFPPIRGAFYPDAIYKATIKNATTATLKGTDDVEGAVLGFPFPIPTNGAEVIWNHKLKFRGSAVRRYNNQAIVDTDGTYKITKLIEDVKFKYANLNEQGKPGAGSILAYYLSRVVSPPRVAGQVTLVHEAAGGGVTRSAWIYNPGLGRVNRAPDVSYDTPYIGTDGMQFTDQVDEFNGALDRYNWKLIGKKEIYIPYNSFLINTPMIKYKDIIRKGHINQNLNRYELHRVWVVEADLKPGLRHQFKKRVFYVDEDSWSIAAVDCYDNRDQLWKVQEADLITAPFVPTTTGIPEMIYDLQSGRYFVTAMVNEDKITDWTIKFDDDYFSPQALKRRARTN